MAERVLRGSRLGAVSYENDRGTELAARKTARYACSNGHDNKVALAEEAEIPLTWECRHCGALATLVDGPVAAPRKVKPARTHWDMLLERRSVSELEALLEERLAEVRGRGPVAERKKTA